MKKFAIASLIFLAIVLFFRWSEKHDEQIQASAEKYEDCIKNQYGVSPANWYAEHGEYPECK